MKLEDATTESKMPKSIKRILVSQQEPQGERSPYHEVSKKHNFKVDFIPFLNVESITLREFRKFKINIPDYTSVIFNSKNAIDYFFKLCDEIRHKMPQEAKYFCSSEQIAFYLQKYIQYRKRKVVYANGTLTDFQNILAKHRTTEKFIMPCSSVGVGQLSLYLKNNKFDFSEAIMYKMIPNQDIKRRNFDYDLVAFFNIEGVKAFFSIFTDFKQGKTIIGAFGEATQKELEKRGYRALVKAPYGEIKSMVMAIEQLFKDNPTLSR